MKEKQIFLLMLILVAGAARPLQAQVELKLLLQPDGITYTVLARPQVTWPQPVANITYGGQVTLVVPAGAFEVENLVSNAGTWQLTNLIESPVENPGAAYAIFKLLSATQALVYEAGQPVPLFSFENKNGCTGILELMNPAADPFSPPNSLNIPAGNELYIEGAAGDAYTGNYDPGSASCFAQAGCIVSYRLKATPQGRYEVALWTDASSPPVSPLEMAQIVVKVPTSFFDVYDLKSLVPSEMLLGNSSRFDAPVEEPGYDYIQFTLNATGPGLFLQPGVEIPLLSFANGGSCQGDSIFLVKNDDPFLPPNSQGANISQQVRLVGLGGPVMVCTDDQTSAPCLGCLFSEGFLKIDSLQKADPVVCLGGNNGTLEIFAKGATSLQFSIDGGQTWSSDKHFGGLSVGSYQPVVKGERLGCSLVKSAPPVELLPGTAWTLHLEAPPTACKGDDVLLKITSPNPLPLGGSYQWTGPAGFSSASPNPVLPDVKTYQSGSYVLTVEAPGCNPASATTNLIVNNPPGTPTLLAAPAICWGEKLQLKTDVAGEKFEWIGPLGQSPATLAMSGLTTTENFTALAPDHPAYLPGDWKVRVTDSTGCWSESAPLSLNIKLRPQAFAENTGAVCPGGNGQLLSNPLPGAIYRWRKAGQQAIYSMQPNPIVQSVSAAQTFRLEVEVDGCLSENLSQTTLALNPLPTVDPVFDYEKAPDCSPRDLSFSSNATGLGLSYQWSGVNGFASQLANPLIPNVSASANGSYLLEVTNIFGCTTSEAILVTGVVNPVAMPLIQSTGPACPGEDIQLSVQTYSGSQVSYQWFLNGNPLPGQVSNILNLNAVQSSDAGNYGMKVQTDGCTLQSAEMPVSLLSTPAVTPDFNLSQPCEGGTLQFFSNLNGIAAWHWTGPNGFSSNSPNPLIYNTKFGDLGAYTLTVTATNGCQSTATIVVDGILAQPDVPLVATNSPVCPEGEIKLQVQNPVLAGAVYYEWINGNGDNVGDGDPLLTLAPGSIDAVPPFLVRSVVNTCPSAFSDPISIEVKPEPVAIAWSNGPICAGETVNLFASTVPEGVYEWRIAGTGVIISIEQNPTYVIHDTTSFELTVRTNGCTAQASTLTVVPANPSPEITGLTGGGSYCEGSPVTLSAGNEVFFSGPVQYTWTGPAGFAFTSSAVATGPFPLLLDPVQPSQQGAYTLRLESPAGCLSPPQSTVVQVGQMPPTPVLEAPDDVLCQGETLELNASLYSGNEVEYHWYFHDGQTDYLLSVTTFPTYFLPSVMPSNSGKYFVTVKVDGCEPQPSNLKSVTVFGLATSIEVDNPATASSPACEGSEVQLSSTLIPGATYTWYGPAGFHANIHNPLLENIKTNQQGGYLVVVELPGCSIPVTGSATVFVQEVPPKPVLTGNPTACEGSEATISVANAMPGATYRFYFGQNNQLLSAGPETSLTLPAVTSAQAGTYRTIAALSDCQSAISDDFELVVVPPQEGLAFAGTDQVICPGDDRPLLQAAQPLTGGGYWTSLDGAIVLQPGQPTTFATGLHPGSNRFVWTLTNGTCPGAGADTVTLLLEGIEARPEVLAVPAGGSLQHVNLLDNDLLENASDWEFFILKKPLKGWLEDDGTGTSISYTPYPHAFGADEFSYMLCSMSCPELCDTALVRLELEGTTDPSKCFVPNLISPNGDGASDTFIIPCAVSFPGSSLAIFNRWGGKIFETQNYQNDWDGKYMGEPLPAGTYFYQLTLKDAVKTHLSGYVVIIR